MPEAPTPANAEVVQYFDPPATFAGDGCVPEPNGGSDEDSSGGEGQPKKVLSTALLAGLMYTLTIGGGYGIEESVMGGGPLLTLLSLILVPLFMGLPMAVVVAEMASAVPSNAGFLMWIHLTYGSMVYLVMAFLSLMLIFIDNAIYPVLFSDYVCAAVSSPCSGMQQAGLRLGIIILTYLLNLAGLEAVGVASLVLTALIVLPFPLMFVVHLFRTGFYLNWPAISTIPSTIDWATFITTVSWNLSGLEQAGAVVEQVQDPQRTILRALVPLLGLSLLTYIPPILTGASTSTGPIDLGEWTTGYWTTTASRVGGGWLMFLTVVGSALSATGLTLSALCTTTSLIAGMAHTDVFAGRLGRWLGRRSARSGAYPISLTLNMLVTAMFSIMLDFGPLVKVDQFLYGIRAVMVILAFFRLRHKYPLLPRPFVLRLTTTTRAGLYISTAAFVAITFISLVADWETFWMCSLTLVAATLSAWLYGTYVHSGEFRGSIVTVSAREAMDPGHHPAMEEPDDDPCIFPTDSSV